MSKNTGAGVTIAKSPNISLAWGAALQTILESGGKEISPLLFCISDFDPVSGPEEDMDVREALDRHLTSQGKLTVDKVAFTIFPREIWELADGDHETFFEDCQNAAPRFRKAHKANKDGLYFERLMNFGADYKQKNIGINQLKQIAAIYAGGTHRRSALQATTYDPVTDLSDQPYLGFPCLQHVTFAPENGELTMNAFYTLQYLDTKAYGNLIGLADLGMFMASYMGMKFTKLTVNAGVEKYEPKKSEPGIVEIAKILRTKNLAGVLQEF
ncbi:MAG: hypothetical protein NUV50_03910 [Rhodospirillales bacterium]|nr:hypothetical protein [Rhodospirillales bacterium]